MHQEGILKVLAMAKADREAGKQVLIVNMKKNKTAGKTITYNCQLYCISWSHVRRLIVSSLVFFIFCPFLK